MAVTAGDLDFHLTGATSDGGAQTDPAASTGGYRSSSTIQSAADNKLWDDVSGAEASAGDTEYRCFAIKNTHASLALQDFKIWMQTTTGNASDLISFAVEVPQGDNSTGSCQAVADESTTPDTSVTFWSGLSATQWSTGTNETQGVGCNFGGHGDADLDSGEIMFVWVKRVVAAGAAAAAAESVTFKISGSSAP